MKIQKILFFLFAALLIISAPLTGFAQINVSTLAELSGESGETAVLPISVTDLTGQNITSFELEASYDTSIVAIESYSSEGTISASLNTIDLNTTTDGKVYVAGFGSTALSGEGELINLNVVFKKSGNTTISFSDFKLGETEYTVNDVDVTVGAVDVSLIDVKGDIDDEVTIDVTVDDLTDKEILSYEFTLKYDETIMDITGMEVEGTLSDGKTSSFTDGDGEFYGGVYSSTYFSGEGVLFKLTIKLKAQGTSDFYFDPFTFNEGSPQAKTAGKKAYVGLIDVILPTVDLTIGDTTLIPVTIADASADNVTAYEFNFDYDVDDIEVLGIEKENTLSADWTVDATINDGVCYVGGFNNVALGEGSDLVLLEVVAKKAGSSDLTWNAFQFNEGTPEPKLVDGVLTITDGPQEMTIAEAIIDADQDFIPDLLDKEVIVTGIVTTPNFNSGTEYAIQDESGAGVTIYSYTVGSAGTLGDSVKVTGTIGQYCGKTEVYISDSADVVVLSSDNTLPDPLEITSFVEFDFEAHENMLAKLSGVKIANPEDWPRVGGYNALDLVMGTDTVGLYIDSEIDLDTWTELANKNATFDLVGMVDQYTKSDSQNDGYQIKPRFLEDFTNIDPAPEVAGVVAVSTTELQVRFTEDVNTVETTNFTVAGAVPTAVEMPLSNLALLTIAELDTNTEYDVTITGVTDFTDLAMTDTTVSFELVVPGETLPIDEAISAWEDELGPWWKPTDSGTTTGILSTSSFELSEEAAYDGTKSAKLTVLDDSEVEDGWFVRVCNRTDKVAPDSKLFLYLKGDATDVQVRITIWDNGENGDGYEVGAWHDITLEGDDWQVVSIDLANDPVAGWITGNGAINSTDYVTIESIQLQCAEDIDATLYFDMFTERQNLAPVEVTMQVNMTYPINWEHFDPSSDYVDVAGTFNDWNGTTLEATGTENDYKAVVGSFYPGDSLKYKFRINGLWEKDKCEWHGISNSDRVFVVGNTDTTVVHDWNDYPRTDIDDLVETPEVFALEQNYPNPFNPTTSIKYSLPENAQVKIMIYDVMGKVVRTLVNEQQSTGYQSVVWDARNNKGAKVSTGVYIYHMQANDYQQTRKMMLVK